MLVDSLNCPDTPAVAPAGNHHNFANVEFVPFVNLPCLQINLYGVVRLDIWVREANRACIVCDKVRHTFVSEEDLLDSAQLKSSLITLDWYEGEAALDIVENAEDLVYLRDLENVHETNGEGRVYAWFVIDQDVLILEDHVGLSVSVSVMKTIT